MDEIQETENQIVVVTCSTDGCENKNAKIQLTVPKENPDIYCGVCSVNITTSIQIV